MQIFIRKQGCSEQADAQFVFLIFNSLAIRLCLLAAQ